MDIKQTLSVNNQRYQYFSIQAAEEQGLGNFSKLPFSLKILLENLLRNLDGGTVTENDVKAMSDWLTDTHSEHEIAYRPARVLMQDFTGVPALVDLAAMRDAMRERGGDPNKINPLSCVDLVIDHSVQVDHFGDASAFQYNVEHEMQRNLERYQFLRWGQSAFKNFRVVPPGTGICHQVNLEHLAKVIWHEDNLAYPDTLVGTDSHTTMINGLGVLGWGVGGIEAEAAMLGQPISMLIPDVIGFKLTGQLPEGITATDLVLTITNQLRQFGVVGKFVEFFGDGLDHLSLADRATIANMAPEYGATCGFFPVDNETIQYLKLTGRDDETIALVQAYCKAQGMWRDENSVSEYTKTLELDLSTIKPCVAGPKRPQDKVTLNELPNTFNQFCKSEKTISLDDFELSEGDVVIAAITSCTNTSNPSVMIAAGLLAKKACELALTTKPWVKTSLAPGSKVVTEYLDRSGLTPYLDQLGFNLVGYGCTTCIGNSGPLADNITKAIKENDLVVASVLSGNRNFEGRVHPLVKTNWLSSPPLVVAYALAGTVKIDITKEPVATTSDGKSIYLKDLWPSNAEIKAEVEKISGDIFREKYADVFTGDETWQSIDFKTGDTYQWNESSTYIQNPPFFDAEKSTMDKIENANILALLGDSITTDHISPAGSILPDMTAGKYLTSKGVEQKDFNSFGARRGNHEIMMRGTFGNIRIKNEMLDNVEGGFTKYIPSDEVLSIYDAAMRYQEDNTPLVVIAGKEYGTGSSRDWAAKGTRLLGVKAVIAESYERIHRSNLIGMGVLPLQFTNNQSRETLSLTGKETISILDLTNTNKPSETVTAMIERDNGEQEKVELLSRLDTQNEVTYYQQGGILQTVLEQL